LNPSSTSCANLSTSAREKQSSSCNESCQTNKDCDINFRCYNNSCRLATNPSSTSCSSVKQKTISYIYNTNQETTPPIKKGDNLIPDEDLQLSATKNQGKDKGVGSDFDTVDKDETLFGLLIKMLKDQNYRLATLTAVVGLILVLVSIVIASIKKIKRTKQPKKTVIPTPPTNSGVKAVNNKQMKDSLQPNNQQIANNLDKTSQELKNNQTVQISNSPQEEKVKELLQQLNSQTKTPKKDDV